MKPGQLPADKPMQITQGDSFGPYVLQFSYKREDVDDPIVYLDFTDWTAKAQARYDVADISTEVAMEFDAEIVPIVDLPGAISLTATPEQTALLTQSGIFDIEVTHDTTGERRTYVGGPFELTLEVTRG